MLDPSVIKESYARMTDLELLRFVKRERHGLTAMAVNLLDDEVAARNLVIENEEAPVEQADDYFEQELDGRKEEVPIADRTDQQAENELLLTKEQFTKIWTYVFDEKRGGASNEEIAAGLHKTGLSNGQVNAVLEDMEPAATKLHDSFDKDILIGVIVFAVGVLLTVVTFVNASGGGTYLIAYGAIIAGPLQCYRGIEGRKKYKAVLDIIAGEKSTGPVSEL